MHAEGRGCCTKKEKRANIRQQRTADLLGCGLQRLLLLGRLGALALQLVLGRSQLALLLLRLLLLRGGRTRQGIKPSILLYLGGCGACTS